MVGMVCACPMLMSEYLMVLGLNPAPSCR